MTRSRSIATGKDLAVRHFVGLCLSPARSTMFGALVRIWGRGLQASADVVACSRCRDARLVAVQPDTTGEDWPPAGEWRSYSAEVTELAAQVIAPLTQRLPTDGSSLRAAGLIDVGRWHLDRYSSAFVPCIDATLLAKLTGVTIIDDFPARDLVHGGRGGPCEAAGAWLMLCDRGIVPGRRIRALVDIDATLRLFLLPPQQDVQLPSQLACYELGPGTALLDGILQRTTRASRTFDARENLAVQGRCCPELLDRWRGCIAPSAGLWTPSGADATPLLQELDQLPVRHGDRLADLLCTAVHLLAEQIRRCVRQHLPPAMPAGQLILAGTLSHHAFLVKQIKTELSEREIVSIHDEVATTECWRAVAAALLAVLHVDQIPMNSPSLTGADTARVLGRLTPGSPANWHRVLEDMATTLPEKQTLRSAI